MHIRILASADLHGDIKAVKKVVKYSHLADVVVVAGDLSNLGNKLRKTLVELNKSKVKVLVVPGNHETEEQLIAESVDLHNIINLHKSFFMVKKTLFLGYGGANFTNTEPDFLDVQPFFHRLIEKNKPEKVVFVTHNPPYGFLDDLGGEHVGTFEFTEFMKSEKLNLIICGHLHEHAGLEVNFRKTKIINPGKFRMIDLF